MDRGENLPEKVETYRENLGINRDSLHEDDREIHDYIIAGLRNLDSERISRIFGVEDPSNILSEGDKITPETVAEDFAVIESDLEGKIAIGQVVSSSSKGYINSKPRDYIQINGFGERIRRTPEINPEITGYYLVKSSYDRSAIHKRNRLVNRDIDLYGRAEIPVEITKVEPDERNIEKSLRGFYSSLTHS